MSRWIRLTMILVLTGSLAPAVHAAGETRVALIIGNSAYQKSELRLPNPANDAAAMARALKTAGFVTIVQLNASRTDFYKALNQFSDKISRDPHAVGLFYYAGHAVQAGGVNWLIPVDANIASEGDLEPSAFDAARVLKSMAAAGNEMNIVILDACRNNPLPSTRGMDRGLARINAPSGTFIAFAAAPGETAQDGAAGTNGVFTGEFIKAMSEPGLPLEQVFKRVIVGVKADTQGKQTPWSESSLQGEFSFVAKNASTAKVADAAAVAASATPSTPTLGPRLDSAADLEQSYWNRIKDSHDAADFKDYKTQYPTGPHLAEANVMIRKLTAPAAPSPVSVASAAPRAAAPTTVPFSGPNMSCGPTYSSSWDNCVGAYQYPNGNKYVGEFHHGLREGLGVIFINATGVSNTNNILSEKPSIYAGEFRRNKLNGHGVWFTQSSGAGYASTFIDNMPRSDKSQKNCGGTQSSWNNCFAVVADESGNIYHGQFMHGQREGVGMLEIRATGTSDNNGVRLPTPGMYVGEFTGNHLNGSGLIFMSGAGFYGMFRNNILTRPAG